jgi:hypothetical protein
MNRLWMCLAGAAALALPGLAFAGSISPSTYTDTIDVGETISVNKTVTTDLGGASKVDVFFLADNTGSMGGTINAVATNAAAILNASEFSGLDMGWGVGRYFGDPIEGVGGDGAYDVLQTITTNHTDVTNAIGGWFASGGGDTPEANLYALQQAASEGAAGINGVSSGEATGWRTGAQRIVAWFGDATGHTRRSIWTKPSLRSPVPASQWWGSTIPAVASVSTEPMVLILETRQAKSFPPPVVRW